MMSAAETVVTTIFMVLVSVIGTAGNFLVVLAVLYKRRLRTIPNYFLCNLALCDLLTVSLSVPLRLVEGFHPGSIPCSIVIAVTVLFDGLSRMNIIFISIDRFVAVKFPFAYTLHATSRAVVVLITCGWIVMTAFAILPLLGVGSSATEVLRHNHGLCFFSANLSKAYLLVFVIGFCLLPVVLATPVNCFLLSVSHRQMRVIHVQQLNLESTIADTNSLNFREANVKEAEDHRPNNISQQNCLRTLQLRQRKVVRMVIVLLGLFSILVLPITLIDLLGAVGQSSVPPIVAKIAVCMIYANATINVFVYAGFNREFRRAFGQIFQAGREQIASFWHR